MKDAAVPNLEGTLLDMITDGQIQAKLDQKQSMISFIDGAGSDYLGVVEELESQNKKIIHLMKELQHVDSGIRTSKQFLKRELLHGNKDESSGGDVLMR